MNTRELCDLLLYGDPKLNLIANRIIIEATISSWNDQGDLMLILFEQYIAASSHFSSFYVSFSHPPPVCNHFEGLLDVVVFVPFLLFFLLFL